MTRNYILVKYIDNEITNTQYSTIACIYGVENIRQYLINRFGLKDFYWRYIY